MRRAWWSAVVTIALAVPCAAQRAADTLNVLPEIRRSDWVGLREADAVQRPFVGVLRVVLVRETDDGSTVPIRARDLAVHRLTVPQAFALATRNLRRRLIPFEHELPSASSELSGMRSIEGASVETSRLLLDDDWRELTLQLGGPIVAVAPLTGSLIFGRDSMTQVSRSKAIPAPQFLELIAGVLQPYGKRDDALSRIVLRWTEAGWHAVPPMTAAEREELQRQPPDKARESSPDGAASVTAPPAAAAVPLPYAPAKPSAPSKPRASTKPRPPQKP